MTETAISTPATGEITPEGPAVPETKVPVAGEEIFGDAHFARRKAAMDAEKAKKPTPTGDETTEEKPEEGNKEPENKTEGEPSEAEVDTVEVNGKKVPVQEILKDAKFEIPVGEETYTYKGIDKLLEIASRGVHANETNRKAKEVVAESQKLVKEYEGKVKTLEADFEKRLDERVKTTLDDLFQKVASGVNPNDGKAIDKQEQGAMTHVIQEAQKLHGTPKPEPEKPKADPEEVVRRILKEEREAQQEKDRSVAVKKTASDILKQATDPYSAKFLKPDKTVNQKVFRAFQREVVEEAARLSEGLSLDIAGGKKIMEQAVKTVLPDFEPFFSKPTGVAQKGAPILRPASGQTPPAPKANLTKRPGESLEEFWERRQNQKG